MRKSVTAYDWEYIENNWQSKGDGIEFRVTHKIKRVDGTDDILYQSGWLADPDKALSLFNERVTGAGGKAYTVPKNLDLVFQRQWKRLGIGTDRKSKIRRTTGRKRSSTTTSIRGMR